MIINAISDEYREELLAKKAAELILSGVKTDEILVLVLNSFKKEKIAWSFEFLTSPDYLGIPVENLAVSVFEGDEDAPRDLSSAKKWEELGILKENIFYLPKEHNWWGAGEEGPCGPDTEIFYIFDKEKGGRA